VKTRGTSVGQDTKKTIGEMARLVRYNKNRFHEIRKLFEKAKEKGFSIRFDDKRDMKVVRDFVD